jgi:hypothetical protein
VKITGKPPGPSWKNETPYFAESREPIPREERNPRGSPRGS